jgi:acyl-coenzyme A synthetase/AMP-(fatty) acid ligase
MTGEQLVIVLRLEDGQQMTDELREDLISRNRRLLNFKRVSGYIIWERDFPRTASLKIKRIALAEEMRNQLDRQSAVVGL